MDARQRRLQSMRDRYAANREAEKAKRRAWYQANKERHRATGRAWAAKNAEHLREYHAEWYLANREPLKRRQPMSPEEAKAARRQRQRRYLDKRRLSEMSRRARKRGQFVEHVDALFVLERDDGVCGICGGDVDPLAFHVDHVVALANGGEHSYANVQAAHPECNMRKGWRR